MEHMLHLAARVLGIGVHRQTSIGMKVPHPAPRSKEQALANLEYVEREVEVCQRSIRLDGKPAYQGGADILRWYIAMARQVAEKADEQHAIVISNVATAILPRINPYAEHSYNTHEPYTRSESYDKLIALSDQYSLGTLQLGKVILDADPDPPPINSYYCNSFKASYETMFQDAHLLFPDKLR